MAGWRCSRAKNSRDCRLVRYPHVAGGCGPSTASFGLAGHSMVTARGAPSEARCGFRNVGAGEFRNVRAGDKAERS